jgi:hypothetical protein
MESRRTLDVRASPDRVLAYFTDPQHLILTSKPGRLVESIGEPGSSGSSVTLAFDQLRYIAEFELVDPHRVIVHNSIVGAMGRGARGTSDYRFVARPDGGTRIEATMSGSGGWLSGLARRPSQWLFWRRIKRDLD